MSSDKARDAISQCLPDLIPRNSAGCRYGYRDMADMLDNALERRGFKVISLITYDRLNNQGKAKRENL